MTNPNENQSNQTSLDIGCVADLCVDLILTGNVVPRFRQFEQLVNDYSLEPGGSATIFAAQFAKLGGRIGLIGAIGTDPLGELLAEHLGHLGIDLRFVRRDPKEKTGLGLHLVKPDGDRATLTYSGTIDGTPPEALTETLLTTCHHWHLASYFLLNRVRPIWRHWLTRCRTAGRTTSLDTNWDPEDRWEGVWELLPLVNVFLPNDAEARAITGLAETDRAGEMLAAQGPLVVIKRGPEGATAYSPEGARWQIPPQPIETIVDAVGAGDNFDAGFLYAWLKGWDIQTCLELGTRSAAASLSAPGGIRGQLRMSASEHG
jgi:sugar/nucleoside kinase (ribokinase family)